jgi:hypothetical protein
MSASDPLRQRRYRERLKQRAQETEHLVTSALSLPRAVRFAADNGDKIAQAVNAPTDREILAKLEAYFFAVAKKKNSAASRKPKI